MNADRRGSAPYGERTSDKWVHVRRKAVSRQARAPSYVVGRIAVTGGPLARQLVPEGLGDKRERPTRSACPDRHRGGLACARPCHPPLAGRSLPAIPGGKAVKRLWEASMRVRRCAGQGIGGVPTNDRGPCSLAGNGWPLRCSVGHDLSASGRRPAHEIGFRHLLLLARGVAISCRFGGDDLKGRSALASSSSPARSGTFIAAGQLLRACPPAQRRSRDRQPLARCRASTAGPLPSSCPRCSPRPPGQRPRSSRRPPLRP